MAIIGHHASLVLTFGLSLLVSIFIRFQTALPLAELFASISYGSVLASCGQAGTTEYADEWTGCYSKLLRNNERALIIICRPRFLVMNELYGFPLLISQGASRTSSIPHLRRLKEENGREWTCLARNSLDHVFHVSSKTVD